MHILQQYVVCQVKYKPGPPVGIECSDGSHDTAQRLLRLSGGRPALHMNDGSIPGGDGE
jgi:hypothetical protein